MRRIKCPLIAKPFSHKPGVIVPLPTTDLGLEIFPTGLQLLPSKQWISFPIKGPVLHFTVELNLDRKSIKIFGKDQQKHFKFWISANSKKDGVILSDQAPSNTGSFERIFLGVSKQPDWELVVRRNLITEILPFWFLLSQITLDIPLKPGDSLIHDLELAINNADSLKIASDFDALWKAGFKGLLFPQAEDSLYLGYAKPPIPRNSHPFGLISRSYSLIKNLFLQSDSDSCKIAPLATALFTYGTANHLKTTWGDISIEWTKHKLRRVDFRCNFSKKVTFTFPKSLKRCRLSDHQTHTQLSFKTHPVLDLQKDCEYFLDHFE